MALDAIDRCKVCGTPYLSALKPGETDADRICYHCHPPGPVKSTAAEGEGDDELVLAADDAAPKRQKHAVGDGRQQILQQIHASAPAEAVDLPADAPDLPPRRRQVQSSPASYTFKAFVLVVIIVVASFFAFQTYKKSQEQDGRVPKAELAPPLPPPPPPPEPPPPVIVVTPAPKRQAVTPVKPTGPDLGTFQPVETPTVQEPVSPGPETSMPAPAPQAPTPPPPPPQKKK